MTDKNWTEKRSEVLQLTEDLQAFFRERNSDPEIARQTLINILVTVTMFDGHSPQQANSTLATYFNDVAQYLDGTTQ